MIGTAAVRPFLLPTAVGVLAAIFGAVMARDRFADAWIFACVLLGGLAGGSLALLMIGRLLGSAWLDPVRSELEAASMTLPLVGLLCLPVFVMSGDAYPWLLAGPMDGVPALRAAYLSPDAVIARGVTILSLWTLLAFIVLRTGESRVISGAGLFIMIPTLTMAGIDWVLGRDPWFWSTVFGFAFALAQMLAALSVAILVSVLRAEQPAAFRLKSLEKALLALALLSGWLWFVQYLVVYMANIPGEAAWYAERPSGLLSWLASAIAAFLAGTAILVWPDAGRLPIAFGSGLLLFYHAALLAWMFDIRLPEGAGPAATALVITVIGIWILWFRAGVLTRPSDEHDRRPT